MPSSVSAREFGRLIRRSTDKKHRRHLDSRIWRKDYGSAFIESLPICRPD